MCIRDRLIVNINITTDFLDNGERVQTQSDASAEMSRRVLSDVTVCVCVCPRSFEVIGSLLWQFSASQGAVSELQYKELYHARAAW